ncbi:MAG TPA: SHOCT domain-containing protein [Candidatus Nanopelagicales bacterium]|nr:SHOCT domain-containing protein [Candidatus Nanopelagicales bacterium]
MSTLAEFGTGEVLWSIVWFTLFFLWIWVLMSVFADIFRSDDLGGWGKALWIIFIVIAWWLGVLVYLIARGKGMQQRSIDAMRAAESAQREYIQNVASSSSATEEIAKAAQLKEQGVISDEEFAAIKAKALG